MKKTIDRLEELLNTGSEYISSLSESELTHKINPGKWSKKEIIGHLIDSGINNLQRFTEIQFIPKPYKVRPYNQDELVKVNDYQNSDTKEMVNLWISLNNRIKFIMALQTDQSLNYHIELKDGTEADLRFLITDYVEHLEHHLNQIIDY